MQAAYEAAALGPIRPERPLVGADGEELFVYGMRCVAYSRPDVELEFNAFVDGDRDVLQLVAEIGRKLKAGAVVKQIREEEALRGFCRLFICPSFGPRVGPSFCLNVKL